MSIFNLFKFTNPQTMQAMPEGKSPVSPGLLKSNSYRQFEKTYVGSFPLKDQASLASALRMRQNATESVQDSAALYCLGKHHEMILEYNHLGHGIEARKSALESLKKYHNYFVQILPTTITRNPCNTCLFSLVRMKKVCTI